MHFYSSHTHTYKHPHTHTHWLTDINVKDRLTTGPLTFRLPVLYLFTVRGFAVSVFGNSRNLAFALQDSRVCQKGITNNLSEQPTKFVAVSFHILLLYVKHTHPSTFVFVCAPEYMCTCVCECLQTNVNINEIERKKNIQIDKIILELINARKTKTFLSFNKRNH